jgi:hypothetical protein
MKTIGILIILFGFYYSNFGQINTSQNNRFGFKPKDIQPNTENPYIQFHKHKQASPWLENNLDWNFKSENALSRNKLFGTNTFKKSDDAISFSGSMPVYHPGILSNIPVIKPDSSINYNLLIKKINQHKFPETTLR